MAKGKVIHKSQEFFSKAPAQDKPAKSWFTFGSTVPNISDEEAFLTILIGAARADDVVSPEEAQEIAALSHRTRTLANLTLGRITELQKHIDEKISRDGLQKVLGAACAAITSSTEAAELVRARAESVFTHAVDLVFADRVVNMREQEYIEDLARNLGLEPDRAKSIVAIIEIKNSY